MDICSQTSKCVFLYTLIFINISSVVYEIVLGSHRHWPVGFSGYYCVITLAFWRGRPVLRNLKMK